MQAMTKIPYEIPTEIRDDVVAMVRDVQAASRRLPSGIALRVADYENASALKRARGHR
jgi:hypothetical protein